MKQQATVVIVDGKPMAEVIRPEACEACHACKYGRQERMLMDLPAGNYRAGEAVELNLPDGRIGVASLLAYGLPLAGLLLGLYLGWLTFGTELSEALGALIMLGVSIIMLKLLEPRLRRSGKFNPSTCPKGAYNEDPS